MDQIVQNPVELAPHSLHKLVCSLKSGLPNEIDFAMHVSTLLANNDALSWSDDYRLVDAICESLQVFVCVCATEEEASTSCYCYARFWYKLFAPVTDHLKPTQQTTTTNNHQIDHYSVAPTPPSPPPPPPKPQASQTNGLVDLTHSNISHSTAQLINGTSSNGIRHTTNGTRTPTGPVTKKTVRTITKNLNSPTTTKRTRFNVEHVKLEIFKMSTVPNHILPQFMNLDKLTNHGTKEHMRIYHRIKHVAELLRQISLTSGESSYKEKLNSQQQNYYQQTHKKKKLCASGSLLRFAALLLFCDDIAFNDIGLDIIANVTPKLSKLSDMDDSNSRKLIEAIHSFCVVAINQENGDIYTINRCLEIVSKLLSSSSHRISSETAVLITENNLIGRLEQLLTCQHDVTLFLSALECCYHISQHQPQLLVDPSRRYLVKLLINLLNCDAQRYFTPSALRRIKLIDERFNIGDSNSNHHHTNSLASAPMIHTNIQQLPPAQANRSATPVQNSSQVLCRLLRILEFVCDWDGCKKSFTNPKQVYSHVFETHISPLPNDSMTSCLWSGPAGVGPGCRTKRPKYSLLTHLNDFHCNPVVLQQCAMRNQQLTTTGSTAIQPPVKPPEHPGYAPNAALMAIKRHAAVGLDLNGANGSHGQPESPLSISVRLTSALILRNLASGSQYIKQALEGYEPVLSEICMANNRDESKTVAECLGLVISGETHGADKHISEDMSIKRSHGSLDTARIGKNNDNLAQEESSQVDLLDE